MFFSCHKFDIPMFFNSLPKDWIIDQLAKMFLKIIFLHLFKKHDALQLSFSFFCFSALFCQKYWVIWSQKETFYRPSNRQYNSVICFSKWKCFWSVLFLNKSQQRGIPQKLLGKCNHLFICISLKQTSISGQQPV